MAKQIPNIVLPLDPAVLSSSVRLEIEKSEKRRSQVGEEMAEMNQLLQLIGLWKSEAFELDFEEYCNEVNSVKKQFEQQQQTEEKEVEIVPEEAAAEITVEEQVPIPESIEIKPILIMAAMNEQVELRNVTSKIDTTQLGKYRPNSSNNAPPRSPRSPIAVPSTPRLDNVSSVLSRIPLSKNA